MRHFQIWIDNFCNNLKLRDDSISLYHAKDSQLKQGGDSDLFFFLV